MDPTKIPKNPVEQITTLEGFGKTLSEYTDSDEIIAEMQKNVTELNGQFSNPEQIKKFKILPRDLNVDFGELTPTLKIRRIQIRENWAEEIEAMYDGA
jgi:long-chain acyl-CoA synthetase